MHIFLLFANVFSLMDNMKRTRPAGGAEMGGRRRQLIEDFRGLLRAVSGVDSESG